MGAASGGAFFSKFTVSIPKNREYLAQLSVRSTRNISGTKSYRGAKMAIRGAKLTFVGGKKKVGVEKASGGRQNG